MQKSDAEDLVFGQTIRELRLNSKKSQEELGLDSGLTRNYISLIELGQRRPSLKTLIKLGKGLNMTPSAILLHFESKWLQHSSL